jgi:3-deoxy-D-manno-octulosonic-acid transferase
MWLLYQAAMATLLLLAGPILLWRRGRHYAATLPGRLGAHPQPGSAATGALWLHAVSVGEAGVAATLARALPAQLPLLVTTITPTGQERARALFRGRAEVAYFPFELGPSVARFFRRFAPRALVLVEGDLWPLVLRAARRRGLPVVVVNGRVSERSFARLRRLRPLLGPLLDPVDRFGVQTAADRERLLALGVEAGRVEVTGNLKYETPEPPRRPELEAAIATLATGRPILVAGSTMAGEEEAVLAAFAAAAGERGGARALLILAPRHPERFAAVAELVERHGLALARRSALAPGGGVPPIDILLLDSLGELAGLYRLAAGAFIGGTLVPTGGHNPLEPARFAVPIAAGPAMDNFREIAAEFDRADAWRRVASREELAAAFRAWLDDPAGARVQGERAAALLARNRGALERTLTLLAPILTPAAPAAPSPAVVRAEA